MGRAIVVATALLMLVACQKPGVPAEAKQIGDVLSGDAKGAASDNPICKLFTARGRGRRVCWQTARRRCQRCYGHGMPVGVKGRREYDHGDSGAGPLCRHA